MSTTDANTRVNTWCFQTRELHEAYTAPFTNNDDPRLALLRDHLRSKHGGAFGDRMFDKLMAGDPEHAVEEYFRMCVTLPAAPFATPSWATGTEVMVEVWPECLVRFSTRTITNGAAKVRWEHERTIIAADTAWPDHSEVELAGKVVDHGFTLVVAHNGRHLDIDGVSPLDAVVLGEAILDAARLIPAEPAELHRSAEPGEPDLGGIGGGL